LNLFIYLITNTEYAEIIGLKLEYEGEKVRFEVALYVYRNDSGEEYVKEQQVCITPTSRIERR